MKTDNGFQHPLKTCSKIYLNLFSSTCQSLGVNLVLSGWKDMNGKVPLSKFFPQNNSHLINFCINFILVHWLPYLYTADPDWKIFLSLGTSKFHSLWMIVYCALFSDYILCFI